RLFEEMGQEPNREKFIALFGEKATTPGYGAIFSRARVVGKLEYPHEIANAHNAHPKGILHTLPYEEVGPIGELDREFRKFGGALKIQLDKGDEGDDLPHYGCLSVGLGFNNITTKLSRYCSKLFEIDYVPLLPKDRKRFPAGADIPKISDDFVINHNGVEAHPSKWVQVEGGEDYALIARILHDGKPYIICAGRTADGTAAALKFLARHWLRIVGLYKEDRANLETDNMVAILSHQHELREPGELKAHFFAEAPKAEWQFP
ncbi:MAG TPA: hypothetical protein VE779_11390, partial [Candidatus Angelobacter sp.]|nr:hypothetical protein [Candidatus Angelobacter sp.]